jgi:hypothetical protein
MIRRYTLDWIKYLFKPSGTTCSSLDCNYRTHTWLQLVGGASVTSSFCCSYLDQLGKSNFMSTYRSILIYQLCSFCSWLHLSSQLSSDNEACVAQVLRMWRTTTIYIYPAPSSLASSIYSPSQDSNIHSSLATHAYLWTQALVISPIQINSTCQNAFTQK